MRVLILTYLAIFPCFTFARPDSTGINKRGAIFLFTGTSAFYGLSVWGMNELWYRNYERSSFHWVNDSKEWLQVDKTGHFLSSYIVARSLSGGLQSVGLKGNKALLLASGISMLGISTIEVFDGFSAGWGASGSDLIFNASGVALFAAQSLIWNEEKVVPKISWHPTDFASFRPDILGSTFPERLLKDYNGHTLWLSFNLKSLTNYKHLPPWLCLSIGYGAEGMISGYDDPGILPYFGRYRQYYLSFDADFAKIKTRYKTMNKIFHHLNFVKVPCPALIFTRKEISFHGFYF